jgi:hypothetical protein
VSYESIPEWLAILITIVWTFYFGGRMMTKDMKGFKARSSKEIREMLAKQKEIHEALTAQQLSTNKDPVSPVIPEVQGLYSQAQGDTSSVRPATSKQLSAEISNLDKPLSLPSIVAWNKKNNPHAD